jgi:hypothetical protein
MNEIQIACLLVSAPGTLLAFLFMLAQIVGWFLD